MTNVTESGWQVNAREEEEGVRYVASLPVDGDDSVEFTSPLAYDSVDEAKEQGKKFVEDLTKKSRGCDY